MGETLFFFFRFIAKQRKLDVHPRDMMDFATVAELLAWIDRTTSNQALQRIIARRKKQGFAYLHLHGKWPEVMDDPHELSLTRSYFSRLYRSKITAKQENMLTGQIAFGGTQKIYGTVVVISDKDNLLKKAGAIKGKILVSVQTTPHFIPYIKNAKAIITDDGGITCHAAIIARELRIPCIVGTKIATTKLKDGDAVSLDMEHGIITVKNREAVAT
jgi:phosphoenolpyruvate synthase/pyruvate phosphate dikinase